GGPCRHHRQRQQPRGRTADRRQQPRGHPSGGGPLLRREGGHPLTEVASPPAAPPSPVVGAFNSALRTISRSLNLSILPPGFLGICATSTNRSRCRTQGMISATLARAASRSAPPEVTTAAQG